MLLRFPLNNSLDIIKTKAGTTELHLHRKSICMARIWVLYAHKMLNRFLRDSCPEMVVFSGSSQRYHSKEDSQAWIRLPPIAGSGLAIRKVSSSTTSLELSTARVILCGASHARDVPCTGVTLDHMSSGDPLMRSGNSEAAWATVFLHSAAKHSSILHRIPESK